MKSKKWKKCGYRKMQRKHMLQYVGNAAYYSFVPSLEEGSFSVASCSTVLSAALSTMLDLSEPSSSAVFHSNQERPRETGSIDGGRKRKRNCYRVGDKSIETKT